MKRGEILDSVKKTITQDRNNRHGEPENSFPLIAERWANYLVRRGLLDPAHNLTGRTLKPSDVAELMAIFKDVRFQIQPENPDNKHDQIGYLAIASELRAIEAAQNAPAPPAVAKPDWVDVNPADELPPINPNLPLDHPLRKSPYVPTRRLLECAMFEIGSEMHTVCKPEWFKPLKPGEDFPGGAPIGIIVGCRTRYQSEPVYMIRCDGNRYEWKKYFPGQKTKDPQRIPKHKGEQTSIRIGKITNTYEAVSNPNGELIWQLFACTGPEN